MAKHLLVLDEVLAMLDVVGAPAGLVQKFKVQAEGVLARRMRRVAQEEGDGTDLISVGSGYGHNTRVGFVELVINETLTQMDTKKAREVGLMLIEAAEAGTSDQMFMTLMRDRIGITDVERLGTILLDLRELRQGTRGLSWPS